MAAWEIALKCHQQHSKEDFWQRLGWHLSCGYVWSTPSVFLLAHTVHWDCEQQKVTSDEQHNAYFVELAACADCPNALRELLSVAPHPMQWVCWRRNNRPTVKAYRWDKLKKKVRI